jgi:hypothetical protein
MIDYGTEVGKVDPAAAPGAAHVVVGSLGRRRAQAFVEVSAPEVRPHENAFLARAMAGLLGFFTLIQSADRPTR